jgi:hypothetical protein
MDFLRIIKAYDRWVEVISLRQSKITLEPQILYAPDYARLVNWGRTDVTNWGFLNKFFVFFHTAIKNVVSMR